MRNRRRSAATQAPERPIDTPSLAFNHMNYTVEDFIDFKESVRRPWRKGRVKELGHHCLIIEPDAGGALVTIYPGKCGRVRQRHGGAAAQLPAELDLEGQAQARARLRIDGVFVAGELPPVRPVRRDGSPLRDFPKPAPPACSPEYLAYVRSHPCCSCPEEGASNPAEVQSEAHHQGRRGIGQKCSDFRCVPLCGLCHLDYTDNGTLPGRDRAAALALLQAAQVELLARWAEREARAAAVFVPVPILRLVAACLALFFCLGMTACGETRRPSCRSDRGELLKPGRFCQEHQQEGDDEFLPIAADRREEGPGDAIGLGCLGSRWSLIFSGRTGNHGDTSWPEANQRRRTVPVDERIALPYTGLSLGLDLPSVSPGLPEALDGACYTEGASRACVSSGNFAAPSWGAALYFHGGLLHEHSYEKAPSYHVVTSAEQGPSAGVAHV